MSDSLAEETFRGLPSVDRLLRTPAVAELLRRSDRGVAVMLVRAVLDDERRRLSAGDRPHSAVEIAEAVIARAESEWFQPPQRVINATGVILHTNLGRAPLSEEALAAIQIASGYSDLELDLSSGERGSRQQRVARLLCTLTGAEAAHVTVSNASAVLLALTALTKGQEVIVSRGEAVEIGGGFRVPEILRQSGARLLEVGTTNRTRIRDYEEGITPRTAAILHVHASNFRVVGFTERPDLKDLAALAHRHGLPLVGDNGSGSLLDTSQFGLGHEPMPVEWLEAGADVVSFSGDKLLGGPQSGILLGRRDLVQKIATHPLARAVRPDKVTLAALAATLLSYIRGDAVETLPIWQMIGQSAGELEERARNWQKQAADRGLRVDLVPGESTVGGGSLPDEVLPTTLIKLPARIRAKALRSSSPPVVGRTARRHVLLDLRTVRPHEEDLLLEAVLALT